MGAVTEQGLLGQRGRKPLLNEQVCALLRDQVLRCPGTPMVELVRLLEAQGKTASGTTISKALLAMGFRREKRRKAALAPLPQTPPRERDAHQRRCEITVKAAMGCELEIVRRSDDVSREVWLKEGQ